ncbi:MAG: EpsG family protein [Ligilactobacillus salivarius]|uniref:EpsG family protein n=1 Tax=Ligilactobacillus salivarius TaxID=1624 RepID=UPI0011CC1D0D|nr:EpsG family protein [Ligilactobacillus salivarius]MCI6062859.1 EpsG family protein [Ligilactobacillus salivarius]MDY5290968.1 EpsG family protein [Ligilactobacillus salivarius]TXJ77696.1 EpsG family protein [Ligilactobacillus salivarius]
MIIYIVCFIFSLIFSYGYEKSNIKLLMAISLSFPVAIAAFRADIIGTDVQVYARQLYNIAINSKNFDEFLNMKWYAIWRFKEVSEFELGYTILVYLSAKLKSFAFLLGCTQFLTIFPLYLSLNRYKNRYKYIVTIGLSIYYLLFFNMSLNMMRQWIAMTMIMLAYVHLKDSKYVQSTIIFIIAVLFHRTAIIGLGVLITYVLLRKNKREIFLKFSTKRYNLNIVIFITIMTLLITTVLSNSFRMMLTNLLGLNDYSTYVNGTVAISINQIYTDIPVLLLFLMIWKRRKNIEDYTFLTFCVFSNIVLSQLSSVMAYSSRIVLYISVFKMLIVPIYLNNLQGRLKKIITLILILLLYSIYWYYTYVIKGTDATVPYVFANF